LGEELGSLLSWIALTQPAEFLSEGVKLELDPVEKEARGVKRNPSTPATLF
jgi:hypothetical protein